MTKRADVACLGFLRRCAAFLLLCFMASATHAAPPPLTIVLIPGTTLTEWRSAAAPTLHQLMASGALAVMNTRTARTRSGRIRETADSALLTLGAGSRAAGEDVRFFSSHAPVPKVGIPAGSLYTRRMGHSPPSNVLVCPEWPRVLHDNVGRGYDIPLGNLGDALYHMGVTVGAHGRFAPLLLSTSAGTVSNTDVPMLRIVETDLPNVDRLLHGLMLSVRAAHGQMLVLSPFVGDEAYRRGERLAPVLLWGTGVAAGLLRSPSTRRAGLVLNTDFAPSVAAHFEAKLPAPAFGRAWTVQADADGILTVSQREREAYKQAALLRLLPYLALLLGVAVLAGTVTRRRVYALAPVGLALTLAVSTSLYAFCLWLAAFMLLAVLGRRRVGTARTVILGCGLLAVVLVADILVGSPLMRMGMLGYSAVEGARFYGLGNEAMGALVGAALVASAHGWNRSGQGGRILNAFALLGIVLLLGTAGAKAGGVLVGGTSFAVLLWTLSGRRMTFRFVMMASVAALVLLLSFAVLDLHGGGHSHFGGALSRIAGGGPSEAWDIVIRKATTESRLLWHSAWAVPLWASVLGVWSRRGQAEPLWVAGVTAVVLCLLVNDAGVVAGALCGSLVWAGIAALHKEKARVPQEALLPAEHGL